MAQVKSEKATCLDKFEVFLNTANQGLIAITTFYLMWYCYQFNDMWSKFSQHCWITTLGYQLLMAEGIMTYYKANSLTSLSSRREKNAIHWILQAVGGAMALYGCSIYIVAREQAGRSHFRGKHGLWGLASMILVSISMVSGLAALFSFEIRRYLKPVMNKFAHNIISIAAFVTGMVSLIYIWKGGRWSKTHDPGNLRYMSAWCIGFITFLTCIGALKSLWFQTIGTLKFIIGRTDGDDCDEIKVTNNGKDKE